MLKIFSGEVKLRGHKIACIEDGKWIYLNTEEPVANSHQDKPCGRCGQHTTQEGHDACLETLPGVMNACCGHGEDDEAYVQFLDGQGIHGEDAIEIQKILRKYAREG